MHIELLPEGQMCDEGFCRFNHGAKPCYRSPHFAGPLPFQPNGALRVLEAREAIAKDKGIKCVPIKNLKGKIITIESLRKKLAAGGGGGGGKPGAGKPPPKPGAGAAVTPPALMVTPAITEDGDDGDAIGFDPTSWGMQHPTIMMMGRAGVGTGTGGADAAGCTGPVPEDSLPTWFDRSGRAREVIDLGWVLLRKRAADGSVERWKARCVAQDTKGKREIRRPGLPTFSPTTRHPTFRSQLAAACVKEARTGRKRKRYAFDVAGLPQRGGHRSRGDVCSTA